MNGHTHESDTQFAAPPKVETAAIVASHLLAQAQIWKHEK